MTFEPPLREQGAPNELRSYLQRRASLQMGDRSAAAPRGDFVALTRKAHIGPTLKSLDAVLRHCRGDAAKGGRCAFLVAPASAGVDATDEAIRLARMLLSSDPPTVLVDLACGATAISGRLGLARAPGFADLAAGRASFEEVILLDPETPLHVIPAGNPRARPLGHVNDRVARILDALTAAYDGIVLHADRESARKFEPMLRGRLHSAVVILAPGGTAAGASKALAELAPVGCSVATYEQTGAERHSGRIRLLSRAPAL
jgi:hypothetical protein